MAELDGRIAWSEIESVDLFSVMTRTLEMCGKSLCSSYELDAFSFFNKKEANQAACWVATGWCIKRVQWSSHTHLPRTSGLADAGRFGTYIRKEFLPSLSMEPAHWWQSYVKSLKMLALESAEDQKIVQRFPSESKIYKHFSKHTLCLSLDSWLGSLKCSNVWCDD